ncbi:hypothetical protein [Streptomyces collinus]|uniref:hypothetical protein n=1 Tax=Streptomyces collinus TaxID=42684 RepID=UPI0033DB1431
MARPRSVTDPRSGRTEEAHSYVGADGTLNVEYEGQVPLRLAAKLGLAVEDAQGTRQAKTFFATEQRINQANDRLRGMGGPGPSTNPATRWSAWPATASRCAGPAPTAPPSTYSPPRCTPARP